MNNEGRSKLQLKRKTNPNLSISPSKGEKRSRPGKNANGSLSVSAPLDSSSTMSASIPLKRKVRMEGDGKLHIPKKKNSHRDTQQSSKEESLTLSQREQRAMKNLTQYIKDCGGMHNCILIIIFLFYTIQFHFLIV